MSSISFQQLSLLRWPQLQCRISRSCDDMITIQAKVHTCDHVLMTLQNKLICHRFYVPDLQVTFGHWCYRLGLVTEGYCTFLRKPENNTSIRTGIPHSESFIISNRNKTRSVLWIFDCSNNVHVGLYFLEFLPCLCLQDNQIVSTT